MLTITALYAGALGVASIVIASQAGRLRGSTQISVGDGGNQEVTCLLPVLRILKIFPRS